MPRCPTFERAAYSICNQRNVNDFRPLQTTNYLRSSKFIPDKHGMLSSLSVLEQLLSPLLMHPCFCKEVLPTRRRVGATMDISPTYRRLNTVLYYINDKIIILKRLAVRLPCPTPGL
jgi:hypothetical protein